MDTRNNILNTASRLFYQQGYDATGINQIIEEAGVAKATLYEHFKSKEDLLVAYLEFMFELTMGQFRQAAASKTSAKDKVSAIFELLSHRSSLKEFHGCQFLNIAGEMAAGNARVYAIIRKQEDGIRALFADILKAETTGKAGSKKTEHLLADGIYLLFDGAIMARKIFGNSWPVHAAHKNALQLL